MFCTMCPSVLVKDVWVCDCPDGHCRHILECPTCKVTRRALVAAKLPNGRPENFRAWRDKIAAQAKKRRSK